MVEEKSQATLRHALNDEVERLKLEKRNLVAKNATLVSTNEKMKATNQKLEMELQKARLSNIEGDARAAANDPLAFHFHMLFQGVKVLLNANAESEGFAMDCFNRLQSSNVCRAASMLAPIPFYEWNQWIKDTFTRLYEAFVRAIAKDESNIGDCKQANALRHQGRISQQEHRQIMEADKQFASLRFLLMVL